MSMMVRMKSRHRSCSLQTCAVKASTASCYPAGR